MATTCFFNALTGAEYVGITDPWQIPSSAHRVEQADDGTFSRGIFQGYATPHAAIAAFNESLSAAYARIDAEYAGKTPLAVCDFCGSSVYERRYLVSGPFGETLCASCGGVR